MELFIYSEMAPSLEISHADYTSLVKLRTRANKKYFILIFM